MTVPFSQRPGRHERHYRRRLGNPLFPNSPSQQEDETLLEMQRLDHEELLGFLEELRATAQRAAIGSRARWPREIPRDRRA